MAGSMEGIRREFNVRGGHFARQDTTAQFPPNTLSPDSTASSTSAQPSGSSVLFFGVIDTLTTCQPAQIRWTFAGPVAPIDFTITNIGVTQDPPPSSSATGASPSNTFTNDDPPIPGGGVGGARTRAARAEPSDAGFTVSTIASSVNPKSSAFSWPKVNVPQGWYRCIATFTDPNRSPSFSTGSSPFFVQNGTDVSCIISSPGSSSTSAPTGSPTTSGDGSENTSAPVGAAQSHVNTGAIAGGVVGGVALLAVVAAVFLCMRCRRNKAGVSASTARGGEGGQIKGAKPGFLGAWGKLGSGSFNDKDKTTGARGDGAGSDFTSQSAVGQKTFGSDSGAAKSGLALAGAGFAHDGQPRSRTKSGGSPTVNTAAASSGTPASLGVVGSVAGFFGAKKASPSSPPANKKSKTKKPYYGSNSRHNSHSESIGGMLSATSTMTSSSAFHGTEEEYSYNPYDERGHTGVPLSPISAGGSSAGSSVRDRDLTSSSRGLPVFRSPFSDPETVTNDSDSVVYGLHGTTRSHRDSIGMMGVIPIAYEPSSIAPSPSPVPSSHLHYDSSRSSAGAVAGHSSPSSDIPSRRNSRNNRMHTPEDSSSSTFERERARTQSHSYSAFRDRDPQRIERERAQTMLSMYHPNNPLPHSSTPQSVPETPRNDSLLTFSSSSSGSSRKHRSKSMQDPSTELLDMSTQAVPMQATASQPQTSNDNTFGRTRRTPRKPVPSYSLDDPSYFATAPHSATTANNSSATSIPSPASPTSPVSPSSTYETSTTLRGSEGKHKSHVEGVSEGQMNVYKQHELLHKDSLGSLGGGKQMMHLLIPDMPPPQRE
ncbi:hypothetical protein VNI00_008711 [Paramarasmius palmivorus]|uniref:Uncharacterized protein n=1 Tax=Paramarasmius palmivorus TaxID=297713 RepID=A0AAW0CXW5_9AGAR